MQRIRFGAALSTIERSAVLRLPAPASKKLPSRSQVAVLRRTAGLKPGEPAAVEVEPVDRWPEPTLPRDFKAALAAAPRDVRELWDAITPMARWEWVRWIDATANPATRKRRVEVSISKLQSGKRRPCCFNLSSCTDPTVSKSGRLIGADGADGVR
jgi:hypothetical protein